MEVTKKTPCDIKGGILCKDAHNQIKLIEKSQISESDIATFLDIHHFDCFNTNNIWIHIPSLLVKMKNDTLNMDMITNKKTILGTRVIQFEQAMGSAIQSFKKSVLLCVDRTRFLPIKSTSDILLYQSNLFNICNKSISKVTKKSLPTFH